MSQAGNKLQESEVFKEKSNRGGNIVLGIYFHVSETDIGIKIANYFTVSARTFEKCLSILAFISIPRYF